MLFKSLNFFYTFKKIFKTYVLKNNWTSYNAFLLLLKENYNIVQKYKIFFMTPYINEYINTLFYLNMFIITNKNQKSKKF
ncbi:hypothetical protein PFUGPA_02136 [Plasmodium falciparum Palo Alto/Uganda]|uniref:Uncharacterized protein n=3 Tax=Plasmodium falciparum TaxID=5833 RepID=A0A024W3I4_PLAFA|nr:hypothetical protein PFTANZ_04046 [Plasmodium falciparum Tanzania (2000708)]ETW56092.1 hypothetical protein PFUGPA_02136 [Plasmodium falciparum Palo Alto/Uganda]EUR68144.1 hypothetical protein PFBG_04109 [Plasmodium falciparum 7G8]